MSKRKSKNRQRANSPKFELNKYVSGISIPVTFTSGVGNDSNIYVQDEWYEIDDPITGLSKVAHIPSELWSRLGGARGLLQFGYGVFPIPQDVIKESWPKKWHYLDRKRLQELNKLGIDVFKRSSNMLSSLTIASFGPFMYSQTDPVGYADGWIEMMWHEYVLENETRKLKKEFKQLGITVGSPGEFNTSLATAWMLLENCAIRIDAMWERLRRFIIPMYFIGKKFEGDDWAKLNKQITGMLSATSEQTTYYNLLVEAVRDFQVKNPLKAIRGNIIHNFLYRPQGVLPTGDPDIDLPQSVEEMNDLVAWERSRLREALVLMASVVKTKTPVNRPHKKTPTI